MKTEQEKKKETIPTTTTPPTTTTTTIVRTISNQSPSHRHYNEKFIPLWMLYEGSVAGFAVSVILAFGGPFITVISKAAAVSSDSTCDPNYSVDFLSRTSIINDKSIPCTVNILGFDILYSSVFSFATSVSVILQVLFLPLFAGLADMGYRNKILIIFTWIGAALTISLSTVDYSNHQWFTAVLFFIFANVALGVCVVILNAFLPDICPPSLTDSVSSKGHAVGFVCGLVVILIDIVILSLFTDENNPDNDNNTLGYQFIFIFSGIWWFFFSLPSILKLPVQPIEIEDDVEDEEEEEDDSKRNQIESPEDQQNLGFWEKLRRGVHPAFRSTPNLSFSFLNGYSRFFYSVYSLREIPQTGWFLLANMFYSDGLWTIASVMSTFGYKELNMSTSMLGISVLVFQIMGCTGCFVFQEIANKYSTKTSIAISLTIFIGLCFYSLIFLRTVVEFYVVTSIGALATGGCSALSRSLFSRMIPHGTEAEFFSIYEITDRGTAWLGPLVFGLVNQFTNSMRLGIISLVGFFVGGLLILIFKVDEKKAIHDVKGWFKHQKKLSSNQSFGNSNPVPS